MSNSDKILQALSRLPANSAICDDCLEVVAEVHPRNQVNKICRDLVKLGKVARYKGDCSVRSLGIIHGRPDKDLTTLSKPISADRNLKGPVTHDQIPGIEKQTNILSQWLFNATTYMNGLENIERSTEPFAARVARLKRESLISTNLSALMQLLNTYRVQVVKGRKSLREEEWKIASQSIAICDSEWQKSNSN